MYETVRANPLLTGWAAGAIPVDLSFIDRMFPIVTVAEQAGRYPVYDVPLAPVADRIGPRTDPWPSVDWGLSQDTYYCEGHGIEHAVPTMQASSDQDAERRDAVYITSRQVQFNKAYAILNEVGDSANWGALTDSPSAKWDSSGTDIAGYLDSQKDVITAATGVGSGFVLAIGQDAFRATLANSVFRDSFKYTERLPADGASRQAFLATYLGVDEVVVVDTQYTTSADGATAAHSALWPAETALLYYRGPAAGVDAAGRATIQDAVPAFARQFYWTGVAGSVAGIASWEVPDPIPGTGVMRVRSAHWYDFKVTMRAAGRLLTNLLA